MSRAKIQEAKVCKYKRGDLVNLNIKTVHKTGGPSYNQFDGVIKECRNGIYRVVNPKTKDWYFANEDEIVKYPDSVKKEWLK